MEQALLEDRLDIQMPVMDGLTATQVIRALEKERGRNPVTIIALTANAHQRDVERSLQAGCNSHLSKPVSKVALLHAIEDLERSAKCHSRQLIGAQLTRLEKYLNQVQLA